MSDSKPALDPSAPAEDVRPAAEVSTAEGGSGVSRPGGFRIAGMPIWVFVPILAVLTTASLTGALGTGMLTGLAVTLTMGWLLISIGNCVPVLRDFGLPIVLCVFGPAILVYAGLMPTALVDLVGAFVGDQGFLDFVLICVIAGAILGMPRALLIKAGVRYAIPFLGTVAGVFVLVGVIGQLIGFGFIQAILFVAAPVMAGGLPLGALPMSEMYAQQLGVESGQMLGGLVSAVLLANVICILCAGILNGLGKRKFRPFVGFNGDGQLLRIENGAEKLAMPKTITQANLLALGQGLLIAGTLFILGTMLGELIPSMHAYAWTTILAVAVKVFGLLPAALEDATAAWGSMAITVFVPAVLTALSVAVIDISDILNAVSDPRFVFLTICAVLLAGLVSGVLGWLVKFYFIEAAITPGLVMADTGGSGDVAVLSAAERMHLIPFATVATRIGGALVLFVTSLMVPFLSSLP